MTTFSKKQQETIKLIQKINEHFGTDRWFTKAELPGITEHSMKALVEKQYLKYQEFNGINYYLVIK